LLLLFELFESFFDKVVVEPGIGVLRVKLHAELVISERFFPRFRSLAGVRIFFAEPVLGIAAFVIGKLLELEVWRAHGFIELFGGFVELVIPIGRDAGIEVQARIIVFPME
jgi:hypothetical protein